MVQVKGAHKSLDSWMWFPDPWSLMKSLDGWMWFPDPWCLMKIHVVSKTVVPYGVKAFVMRSSWIMGVVKVVRQL